MAKGVDFEGSNKRYGPPEGVTEEQCATLNVFINGNCIVSAWELTDEELAEINRSKRVFLSVWSGRTLFPVFVGSESVAHQVVADFGAVWPLSAEAKDKTLDARDIALKACKEAFDDLFTQCASNGMTNAWGKPINHTKLNEAKMLVDRLLPD